MTRIDSIVAAEHVLAAYIPQVKELLGKDVTLDRMIPLMELLGNPQDKLKIIHVAGTSGKTSTAYYIASLLKQSGKKVGLTVSPHIDSVKERVQIDLCLLSDSEFCENLEEFMCLIKHGQLEPTYFELLMAFAYWYFAKTGVDYAVVETGLGGTHDASNVVERSDKVCVITDIGYDHMHVLGHTLGEIASQKAGIVQDNNQVFMYTQTPEINNVAISRTTEKHATLNMLSEQEEYSRAGGLLALNDLPKYQQRNWLLARRVFQFILNRDHLSPLDDSGLAKTMEVEIPGRMDIRYVNGKTIIMDGAHNEQKIRAFVTSFQVLYPAKKAAVVLALKGNKETEIILPILLPICSDLIITTFDVLQDLPSKSAEPELVADVAATHGFKAVRIIKNPIDAYNQLIDSSEDLLVITGSFYLLSCIRPAIMNNND